MPAPIITGATLTSGNPLKIGGNNTLNISGTGFNNGSCTVTINATGLLPCTVPGTLQGNTLVASFSPQFTNPPPSLPGSALRIVVINVGGTSPAYSQLQVTYPEVHA